jgi:hypothetical protein
MRLLTRALSRAVRPPVRWAALYLAAIPLFAVAFAALPRRSLHDTNALYEPATGNDATRVIDSMTPEIRRRLRQTSWQRGVEHFSLDRKSLEVVFLRHPEEGHVFVALAGDDIITGRAGLIGTGHFLVGLEAFLAEPLSEQPIRGEGTISYPVTLINPDTGTTLATSPLYQPPVSLLMPSPPASRPTISSVNGTLTVTFRTAHRLVALLDAAEGDPYAASGRYWRFLYLSATTITTLGLGDITPLTDTARLLIWVEAVTGLVLIGLFLSSLAQGVRGKPKDSSATLQRIEVTRSRTRPRQADPEEKAATTRHWKLALLLSLAVNLAVYFSSRLRRCARRQSSTP